MRTWKGILLVLMGIGFVVLGSSSLAITASLPPNCYLSIPNITGGGPGGQIVVYGLNHIITTPANPIIGGGTGRSSHQAFTIVKSVDQASPLLYKTLCMGTHIPT
jgi:type VI secretion system Hcp family effector